MLIPARKVMIGKKIIFVGDVVVRKNGVYRSIEIVQSVSRKNKFPILKTGLTIYTIA